MITTTGRRSAFAPAIAVVMCTLAAVPAAASAAIGTTDLTEGATASGLAEELVGSGVTISNVQYQGAGMASGLFTGGLEPVGFDSGVVLTSGSTKNVIGPNTGDSAGADHALPGDPALSALAEADTGDASVLSFDFVPRADRVSLRYTFASDEYNEYVYNVNDVFALFVNGQNCARVPGSGEHVAINTINGGIPYGAANASHPELFRNNDLEDGGGDIDTELDGLTVTLTCVAEVEPNATNQIRVAIADASDFSLDSAVFLEANSFTSCVEDGPLSGLVHGAVEPGAGGHGGTIHELNCELVVPAETALGVTPGATVAGRRSR